MSTDFRDLSSRSVPETKGHPLFSQHPFFPLSRPLPASHSPPLTIALHHPPTHATTTAWSKHTAPRSGQRSPGSSTCARANSAASAGTTTSDPTSSEDRGRRKRNDSSSPRTNRSVTGGPTSPRTSRGVPRTRSRTTGTPPTAGATYRCDKTGPPWCFASISCGKRSGTTTPWWSPTPPRISRDTSRPTRWAPRRRMSCGRRGGTGARWPRRGRASACIVRFQWLPRRSTGSMSTRTTTTTAGLLGPARGSTPAALSRTTTTTATITAPSTRSRADTGSRNGSLRSVPTLAAPTKKTSSALSSPGPLPRLPHSSRRSSRPPRARTASSARPGRCTAPRTPPTTSSWPSS